MNARSLSTVMIVAFLVLGGIFIGMRHSSRRQAQIAEEDSRWRLTYDISFETDGPDAQIRIARPFDTRHCEVLDDDYDAVGLRSEERGPFVGSRNRELRVSARRPDAYNVTAKFELLLSPRADVNRQPRLEALDADTRQRCLRDEQNIPVLSEAVQKVIQGIPDDAGTRAERLQWIFDYCADIDSSASGASDDPEVALAGGSGSPLAWARAMTALCRAINIPARLVTGFDVKLQPEAKPRVWVEVYQQQQWRPFDPEYGYMRYLPMPLVPVVRECDEVVRPTRDSKGSVSRLEATYSIERMGPPDSVLQAELPRLSQIFDLTRLPQPMHEIMSILLLLPFGALITSLMRNVIGIRTFGTFAPALLAMSFIYANWATGLAILTVVVTAGLFGRGLLQRLHLLMVPRLSIILTTVILCVVFGVSLFDFMGLTPSAQAVLLPMVILTILIERFYVTTEEDGVLFSIQLAIGTVVVAVLCYVILGWEDVGAFVLRYPEAHFITIAAFIMLGRYAGYRLTELWRFRDLTEPSETTR